VLLAFFFFFTPVQITAIRLNFLVSSFYRNKEYSYWQLLGRNALYFITYSLYLRSHS